MYVLAVVAMLESGAVFSLPEFELYNTKQVCLQNAERGMYDLGALLEADGHKIKVVSVACVPAVPALEKNPYERGA